MNKWEELGLRLKNFFVTFGENYNYVEYILQFILIAFVFYTVFKLLKFNKSEKFFGVIIFLVLFSGLTFTLSDNLPSADLIIVLFTSILPILSRFTSSSAQSETPSLVSLTMYCDPFLT